MSKLFKRRNKRKPVDVRFCFQANNDEMLFFPTLERLRAYYEDYSKKNMIHKLSAFKLEFYNIENYDWTK